MLTIHQMAERTGVTIRALRYYDKIGLLPPGAVSPAGYRLYGPAELERLQQILFFSGTGVSPGGNQGHPGQPGL